MFPTSASRREKAASVLRGFPREALSRGRRRRDPVRAGLLECRSGFEPCHNRVEPVGALLDPALPDRERVPQCGYSALRSGADPKCGASTLSHAPGQGTVSTGADLFNCKQPDATSLVAPQSATGGSKPLRVSSPPGMDLVTWTLERMSRACGTCSRARGQFLRREGARPR